VFRSRRQAVRRAALRELIRAFPARTGGLALLALLSGVLPAAFAALIGVLVGQIPGMISAGLSSAAAHRAIATLVAIAATLIMIELAGSAQEVISTDLYRRFDGYLLQRVMSAALSRDDLRIFDDPELAASLGRAVQVARFGPGELVSGLSTQWTARTQGLAAAVLVGYYWPAAAILLAAVWLVVARALQASYYRANPFWTDPLRRARYVQRIGLLPAWAKEVRVFGLVGWLVEQYRREWATVMSHLWQARRADRRLMVTLGCVVLAANLAVLLLLASSAVSGSLHVAALVVILQGIFGMAMIANLHGDTWIENGSVPIPDVLAMEQAVAGAALARPAGGLPANGLPARTITFRGVSYHYPGAADLVLDGLDLDIVAGRSLAIVGLNGAGKTTLVKLLAGLCQPTSGNIVVDSTDLADLDLASWRRQLAVIFQEFVRYELPMRDNVGFGAVEQAVGDRALAEVMELAGASELTAGLHAGADTTLSPRFDGGVDLSGGQWQRLAFARALMAVRGGARVLVMDEPTAHLDVRAEAELYDRFIELTKGLTTIVISHRFSTVRRADRIVVLEQGRLTEDGSHFGLLAAGGRYARMFRMQASSYHGEYGD
jgi:ATP-binding cassette, subfamily B, bacterial